MTTPANESLTMTMAKAAGIDVPPHGLLPTVDGGWIYVVRRFDRAGRNKRISVEDFAQFSGATRETKSDTRKLWLDYFCSERLRLPGRQVDAILADFAKVLPQCHNLIDRSHLPEEKKGVYRDLLTERTQRLEIGPKKS